MVHCLVCPVNVIGGSTIQAYRIGKVKTGDPGTED